jgi:methylmalonyl-CoA mutase
MGSIDKYQANFPTITTLEWQKKAEASLKGNSVETLSSSTYENIKLKPLYTQEDFSIQNASQFPGFPDFRRGTYPLGYVTKEWKVAQNLLALNSIELGSKLSSALENGQTALAFEVTEHILNDLPEILKPYFKTYPFSLNTRHHQVQLLTVVSKLAEENSSKEAVGGYIATDPLANLVELGFSQDNITTIYDQWVKTIAKFNEYLPNVKTILVDTTPYHNGGANAVQELAVAMATGVYHMRLLTERMLSLETILQKMIFKFAIGSNFFIEIAKLRAAKILWGKIAEAYGANNELQGMVIAAETSSFTKTIYDTHVNLLRSASEAFSAVLGGIEYLHVRPYNVNQDANSPFSERIARNTQLILKEEVFLNKVVDPAGGSWYIESLTNELAEKAWEMFLTIDDQGGIFKVLKSNWLQEQINEVKTKRQTDVLTKKQSVIGTNVYEDSHDQSIETRKSMTRINNMEACGEIIQPISQERLTEPYEAYRRQSDQLKQAPDTEVN